MMRATNVHKVGKKKPGRLIRKISVQKIPADLECRVRFKIGLELRLELASKMISATLK